MWITLEGRSKERPHEPGFRSTAITPQVERLRLPTNLFVLKRICRVLLTHLSGPGHHITGKRQKGKDNLAPEDAVRPEEGVVLGWWKSLNPSVCWIFGCGVGSPAVPPR